MNTNIRYRGDVTVKIKNHPPVKKKNNGTTALFHTIGELLTQILSNSDPALYTRRSPSYMTFLKGNLTEQILTKSYKYSDYSSTVILLTEMPVVKRETDSTGEIELSALLNSTNMSSDFSVDQYSKGTLILLDGTRDNILACVEMDLDKFETVKSDVYGQATITWNMSFNNIEQSTNKTEV